MNFFQKLFSKKKKEPINRRYFSGYQISDPYQATDSPMFYNPYDGSNSTPSESHHTDFGGGDFGGGGASGSWDIGSSDSSSYDSGSSDSGSSDSGGGSCD